jgi:acyl-CoA thioester hydrolase
MPAEARIRVPLRWRDMDMLGHLNQAVFHELLEDGRAALFRSLSGADGFPFVLARIELDYRREVRHADGHFDVVVRVARVGRTSVTLDHAVLLPDGTVAAEGRSVLVGWDGEARRSRELSARERSVLE